MKKQNDIARQLDQAIDMIRAFTEEQRKTRVETQQLRDEVAELRLALAEKPQVDQALVDVPISKAYALLGYKTAGGLRNAIRDGEYKSGLEITRRNGSTGRYLVNVAAIRERLEKEQTKRRVC